MVLDVVIELNGWNRVQRIQLERILLHDMLSEVALWPNFS